MPDSPADPSKDDQDVQLLHGSATDFGRFYERHEDYVLGFFLRRAGSAEAAADMTAETFVRALAARRRFNPSRGEGRAWLTGIARHVLSESVRAGRTQDRMLRRVSLERLELDDAAIERIDEASEEALAVLDTLPDDQRVAITEHVLHGEDYARLAPRLGCSHSVLRQRVSRGIKSMRMRLEESRS